MHHRHHRRWRRERSGHRHGHGFGPWAWRGRFFRAGELRIALLSLLGERASHGYELMKALEARSGGLYRASAGSVYPTLQQLEDEGLVSSAAENGKRVYQINAAGREELELEADVVEDIWRRGEDMDSWGFGEPHAHELWRMWKALYRTSARVLRDDPHPDRLEQIGSILREARRRIRDLSRDPGRQEDDAN